ncbi:histidine phosphatase family protein [Candidatus Falkowbacteria bacterium]|nr:histidine phosphatase family protein [Candidatus Falkowbacteria bacterium]
MKIIVVRHGETEENLKGIIMGHDQGTLTALGYEQAKKAARALEKEKIDAVFTSDLARAAETAKIIAAFHTEAPFFATEKLRERDYGAIQGMNKADVDWEKCENELESLHQVQSRAVELIDAVWQDYPQGQILAVSHGAAMRALVALAKDESLQQPYDTSKPGNTAIYRFEYDGKKLSLTDENNLKHLIA